MNNKYYIYDKKNHSKVFVYRAPFSHLGQAFNMCSKVHDLEAVTDSFVSMKKLRLPITTKSGETTLTKEDKHWYVLSFDLRIQDPKNASVLTYSFYYNGWPCSISFEKVGKQVSRSVNGDFIIDKDGKALQALNDAYEMILKVPSYDFDSIVSVVSDVEKSFNDAILSLERQ